MLPLRHSRGGTPCWRRNHVLKAAGLEKPSKSAISARLRTRDRRRHTVKLRVAHALHILQLRRNTAQHPLRLAHQRHGQPAAILFERRFDPAAVPADRKPAIVSEMLDDRNRALAQVAEVDDVIVSDEILSLILAQISEEVRLDAVFTDLLDADGSEIYLRPVADYVALDRDITYATVVEAARLRGETAIGYRDASEARNAAVAYGVRVNPPKSAVLHPDAGDRVVVLAED